MKRKKKKITIIIKHEKFGSHCKGRCRGRSPKRKIAEEERSPKKMIAKEDDRQRRSWPKAMDRGRSNDGQR